MEVKDIADVAVADADETETAGFETEEAITEGTETECIGTEDAGVDNAAGEDTVKELLWAGATPDDDEARTEDGAVDGAVE